MANNSKEEPRTAPQPDRWYNLTLGPSYHHSSNKFCTLRYEFKPASIDKSKAGKLHKTKENRVSVEFQNNQIGKPKVAFEGSTEDYKDNDAVLFFDGETFRLERLHRAVKSLRHVRKPGESAAAAQSLDADPVLSPLVGRGAKPMHMPTITTFNPVPVEVERIDIGEPQTSGAKPSDKRVVDQFFESPRRSPASPEQKNDDTEENHDIDLDELFEGAISDCEDDKNNNEEKNDNPEPDNNDDMNVSRQNDSDEEIADVDDSGDEGKGQNAADALRAQLNAEAGNYEKQQSSSSSSSSGSESGSGSSSSSSSSSSSGSEAASDDDSVNSV